MSTTKAIREACDRLGVTVRSYSGRSMYGRTCIGFEVNQGTSAAQFAFQLAYELMEDDKDGREAAEELSSREWSQDSLGHDTIVYVPGMAWDDSDDGEEDEEEEDDLKPGDLVRAEIDAMLARQNEDERNERELFEK